MSNIDIYLEELHFQDEVLAIFEADTPEGEVGLPKMDVKNTINKMKKVIDIKDPEGSMKKLKGIAPPGFSEKTVKKMDSFLSKKSKDYNKMKRTASQVVKNSIGKISPKMADVAGSFIAFSSMFAPKNSKNINPQANLKNNIKKFISKARGFGEDFEDDAENKKLSVSNWVDIAVGWTIVVTALALAIGIGGGVFVFLSGLAGGLATGLAAGIPAVMKLAGWALFAIGFVYAALLVVGFVRG